MTTVREIYDYLDKTAPFANQDKSDNSGFLIGDFGANVDKVLVCLDATNKVIDEAKAKSSDLIIAHHPLMYRPVSRIMRGDPIYSMIAGGINFLAYHTNLDMAVGCDLMLSALSLPASDEVIEQMNPDGSGYGKVAELDSPISAEELAVRCSTKLECNSVRYVDGGKPIRRIGVCTGGGGDLTELAMAMGCDAYICGDLRHDRMTFAANHGFTLIDAGHYRTEDIFCGYLTELIGGKFPNISVEEAVNCVDVCKYV
ncbi:MAG: Nif3-like dinuclear metal center hexameric protein [Oscillospiraceae bacterium]|nr:Nif3-like dinuclear metal center hexameric protein [Oscillospiraceae bacterium]